MAKKKHYSEKVVLRGVNWGCLLLGLVLTVLAIFAYSKIILPLEIMGVSTDMTADEITGIFENEEFYKIPGIAFMVFFSILSIIALINVIRVVIGWFFFIGKNDSRRMAQKLSKHAKISFAITGTAIAMRAIHDLNAGAITSETRTLFILAGVIAGVFYLAVRYYRWFSVEKREISEMIFSILRDAMIVAIPIMLFSAVNADKCFETVYNSFRQLIESNNASDKMVIRAVSKMFEGLVGCINLLLVFSTAKVVLKLLPFDNYKRKVAAKVTGKCIAILIITVLMFASMGITNGVNSSGEFDASLITDSILENVDMIIQIVALMASSIALRCVGEGRDKYSDVKLAGADDEEVDDDEEDDE